MAELWYPKAKKNDRGSRPLIRPVGIVLHTAVANASDLPPSGDTKWNFYLAKDGTLHQYYAANEATAAQVDGNRWYAGGEYRGFLALESWDGYGTDVWPAKKANSDPGSGPKWTPEQVETIVQLLVWLHKEHGIKLIKATGVQGEGVGYHSQFLRPKPQKRWTSSHACPGRARIAQVPGIIAEAVRRVAAPAPKPPVNGDSVTPQEIEAVAQRTADLVWFERIPNPSAPAGSVAPHASQYLVGQGNEIDALKADLVGLRTAVNSCIAKLDELINRGN